jgi:DNA repair exonuclease SbcCD nuclease subunit
MGKVRMIPGRQGGRSAEPPDGGYNSRPARDIVVVHSSDLHVDDDYTARIHGGDGTAGLACVLLAARSVAADVVLLAGDTFENNRLPDAVLARTAAVMSAAAMPLVLLPGNHDPAVADAVYGRLGTVENLHVLGVTHDEAVVFTQLGLEIWGRAHRDYGDMMPFETVRPRRTRWQIAMAHGHYEPAPDRSVVARPSWLIGDDEIAATGADYVALGHWNRAARVGNGKVAAYYSGSPEYAGTVNVVRFMTDGQVVVTHAALDIPREVAPQYVPE